LHCYLLLDYPTSTESVKYLKEKLKFTSIDSSWLN